MSDFKDNGHGTCGEFARRLNSDCYCTTLDRDQLNENLLKDTLIQNFLSLHPHFFSNTSVFLARDHLRQMENIIRSSLKISSLPGYQAYVLSKSPELAGHNPGTKGVFMGYDFHLGENGPKIIEINTNAGGAFLNAALIEAQSECCRINESVSHCSTRHDFENKIMEMFHTEWRLQMGSKPLSTVAIIDEKPGEQYLYPEFLMAKRLFSNHGLEAIIADPGELTFMDGVLAYRGKVIDLVYNRLTDFYFENEKNSSLRQAYLANAVVVTPNPRHHALYANKRNLGIFGLTGLLKDFGAESSDIAILNEGIPPTHEISAVNAAEFWASRRNWFFKPVAGYGSRAAYRGDKLTKGVWNEIIKGNYVAQQWIAPEERGILLDGKLVSLKMDMRAYVYDGCIQLLAARLYQGQTTNFRTLGGGFAPVFLAG